MVSGVWNGERAYDLGCDHHLEFKPSGTSQFVKREWKIDGMTGLNTGISRGISGCSRQSSKSRMETGKADSVQHEQIIRDCSAATVVERKLLT